jgi:hypothetical protein
LENWIVWPKNTFQKIFEASISNLKNQGSIITSVSDVQKAIVDESENEITDAILDVVRTLSDQIIKKAPFDRVSYIIEYEQSNASHEVLVREIWGPAFEAAKHQWFIARDSYAYVFNNHVSLRNKFRKEAVGSIATRSLLVFREILSLCKSGFPDGAMARWRTLYELYIVFVCINKIKGDAFKLFLVSEEANTLRYEIAILKRQSGQQKLRESKEERLSALKTEFGNAILEDYGWAAIGLNRKRVNLRDLEEIADHSHQRSDVKFASRLIHANHLRPEQLLGYPLWSGSNGPLIGPSPYGIHFALSEAVRTLALLTIEFTSFKTTVDTLMLMNICIDNKKKFDRKIKSAETMMKSYTSNVNSNWQA